MNDWILPCLLRSASKISPEDWDSTPATTNTGETQHAWTNSLTGIGLSPVEAIEKYVRLRSVPCPVNTSSELVRLTRTWHAKSKLR